MDSPLSAIAGSFEHAIFTTYTFDPVFFDQWIMPLLVRADVRNIVVFVDAAQLALALDTSSPTRAGRAYHVAAVRSRGAFHPKLIWLGGRNHQRACVSSANLTTAGQLRNLEVAFVLDTTMADHGDAFADIAAFLRRLAADQPHHVADAVHTALPAEVTTTSRGSIHFLHNLDSSIAPRLPHGQMLAAAPFVDTNGSAAQFLEGSNGLTFVADAEYLAASSEFLERFTDIRPVRFLDGAATRRLHGKAYWSDEGQWVALGSPNLTAPALLQTAANGNIEAAMLIEGRSFQLPEHEVADLATLLADAPRRLAEQQDGDTEVAFTYFKSEFTDGQLLTELPDDTLVDQITSLGWDSLGSVKNGCVAIDDTASPTRLRAHLNDERIAYSIVHYVAQLPRVGRGGAIPAQPKRSHRHPWTYKASRSFARCYSISIPSTTLYARSNSIRRHRRDSRLNHTRIETSKTGDLHIRTTLREFPTSTCALGTTNPTRYSPSCATR